MSLLVTGGTGFLGGAVLRRVAEEARWSVIASARSESPKFPNGVSSVRIAGLGANTDWSNVLEDVQIVVHCAARTHMMREEVNPLAEYRRVNVDGTLNFARQAAATGVKRFVFVSSIKVNGEVTALGHSFRADDEPAPEDAYGTSKREAEDGLMALSREMGMEVVIIRPPLVYGPGVKGNFASMGRWVAKGVPLPLGAVRHNRRTLVALDNLVDLIVTCIDHPLAANEVFLAGDGEDLSTAGLLERLARAMNRPSRLIPVPVWILESVGAALGKRNMARRLCGSLQVDISKARDLLGWEPPVTVDEGLGRAVTPLKVV